MIISVDPGANLVGAAAWDNGKLQSAMLARGKSALELAQVIHAWVLDMYVFSTSLVVVVERPQVYPRSRTKGDPNDLITLALVAGMVAGKLDPAAVVEVKPREWKGQVPKDAMIERIKRTLPLEEYRVVAQVLCPPRLKHNVWDAVGLGLWYLKRL